MNKNKIAIDSSRKRPKSEVERLCDNTKLRELTNLKSKYSLEKVYLKQLNGLGKKENLSK